jgi:hypothetical protein
LKLAGWFWKRRLKKTFSVFLLFYFYFSLGRGVALHLNNLKFPAPRMLCTKSGYNWPSGSGEKFTDRQTDRQTHNGQSEKLTCAFISGELKLKVLYK